METTEDHSTSLVVTEGVSAPEQGVAEGYPVAADAVVESTARLGEAVRWTGFLVMSYLLLRPVLLTAIVADDYINPFFQFDEVGVGLRSITRRAIQDTYDAGHFNYVGQIVGGLVNGLWILTMGELGIRYSLIYSTTKFAMFVLTALVLAAVVRDVAHIGGRVVGTWTVRVVVAFVLFGTLQLHIGWSNDPVGSYPLSGYASVALGLFGFSRAVRAMSARSVRSAVLAGVALTVAVTYYEINLAVVVGLTPVVAVLAFRRSERSRRSGLVRGAIVLGAPLVTVAVLKVFFAPRAGTYGGTEVSAGTRVVGTFTRGLVSSLPGAAWPRSRDYLGVPFEFSGTALAGYLGAAAIAVVLVLRTREDRPLSSEPLPSKLALGAAVIGLAGYGAGATLIQSLTDKVQDESPGVGYVYNYYAISATMVAFVLALSVLLVRGRVVLSIAAVVLVPFGGFQAMVNQQLTERLNVTVGPNRALLVAATEDLDLTERCAALQNWAAGGWPLYYEEFMIDGLQAMHNYFDGEAFCPTILEPIP